MVSVKTLGVPMRNRGDVEETKYKVFLQVYVLRELYICVTKMRILFFFVSYSPSEGTQGIYKLYLVTNHDKHSLNYIMYQVSH